MAIAGASGAATSILHKLKVGLPVTAKSLAVDVALASCAMVLAYIVSDLMGLSQEMSRAVYFGSGWLGSRLISIVEQRADKELNRIVNKFIDKI